MYCSLSFSQKIYKYYIYTSDYNSVPEFVKENGFYYYDGANSREKGFYDQFTILEFDQAFPNVPHQHIANVLYVETLDGGFIKDLIKNYPSIYLKFDDLTEEEIEYLSFYPNDYGTTSPIPNQGAAVDRRELDYMGVPEAWDITTGNSNIKIGISDRPVNDVDADFLGKVSFTNGYSYDPNNNGIIYGHGTGVAALAIAQGNNAHGSVGICYDCDVVSGPSGYSKLYEMAQLGAKVINMSWGTQSNDPTQYYSQVRQDLINSITDDFGVVFVAAAGNQTSFSSPESYHSTGPPGDTTDDADPDHPFGTLYYYPAMYDNVISVSSVYKKYPGLNPENFCCTNPQGIMIWLRPEDSASSSVNGNDINNPIALTHSGYFTDQGDPYPTNTNGLLYMLTLNEGVDLLAPGQEILDYFALISGNEGGIYNGGTSFSAPFVAGTIGLMLSVDDCLNPNEVESILKLSSKDIEHASFHFNTPFYGKIGTGKLEVGKSVLLTDELNRADGQALVEDHIFYRYDFSLNKIMNNLTLNNVAFIEDASVSFTSKNSIYLGEGTILSPNSTTEIVLNIDENITNTCIPTSSKITLNEKVDSKQVLADFKLFPTIVKSELKVEKRRKVGAKINSIIIYNVFGAKVYRKDNLDDYDVTVKSLNLSKGIYILNALNENSDVIFQEKFLKE
ncbi:hypothetical protein GCM10009117_03340 [Gangjinia marincola]|uniref:Peptidase S8/S53 domain-containing protein n=2 Tax=Gangjinia marincola TaxID=578463 RepID=A0ABN1MDK6_9FLAO